MTHAGHTQDQSKTTNDGIKGSHCTRARSNIRISVTLDEDDRFWEAFRANDSPRTRMDFMQFLELTALPRDCK